MQEQRFSVELVIPATRFSPGDMVHWRGIVYRVRGLEGGDHGEWFLEKDTPKLRTQLADRWYELEAFSLDEDATPYARACFEFGNCPTTCCVDTLDREAVAMKGEGGKGKAEG